MRKFALATAVAGLLLTNAGPANAAVAPLGFDCHFVVFAYEPLTGEANTYTGFAVGYSDVDDMAQIRCFVAINGGDVASTQTGTGVDFAVTAGQVTFTASPGDEVLLCAQTGPGLATINCRVPSMITTADYTAPIDPLLCPVLALLNGLRVPGVVEVDAGDLYILNRVMLWDCPPYEDGLLVPASRATILYA